MAITQYEDFLRVHEALLLNAGLPRELYQSLFEKLSTDNFDAGNHFQIEQLGENRLRRLVLTSDQLKKHGDVFLIDHAWSFRLRDARKQLAETPGLANRMAALMGVADPEEEASEETDESADTAASQSVEAVLAAAQVKADETNDTVRWLELDELGVTDGKLNELQLATSFPGLVGLSLWGNALQSLDSVVGALQGLGGLRALWLNETPVDKTRGSELKAAVLSALPHLQLYNRQLTPSYSHWAVAFCADIYGAANAGPTKDERRGDHPLRTVTELDLSERGLVALKPEVFSPEALPLLTSLDLRGNPLAGQTTPELLHILGRLPSLQILKVDVPGPLGPTSGSIVEALPRLELLNGVPVARVLEEDRLVMEGQLAPRLPEWAPGEPLEERVMRAMWQYVQVYRLATEEQYDDTPVWYVMDEVGSALRHSDEPSMALAPFLHMPDGTLASAVSYSLLWPIRDLQRGDEGTRDFLPGIGEDRQRSARLTAWFLTPRTYFKQAYEEFWRHKPSDKIRPTESSNEGPTKPLVPRNGKLTVFTDLAPVRELLTHSSFAFVEEPRAADIVFTNTQIDDQFRKAEGLRPEQIVNQFPFEACLVMKHHLAATMQQAYGRPAWLQPTYNMESELAALIGDYQGREEAGEDPLWIVKPWNLARSLDSSVLGGLPQLVRMLETGPKVCQKYIQRPALFRGRKFDLRFLVLLRSLRPLDVLLHDVFWSRIANKAYSTRPAQLEEFETQFTVMNYAGGALQHVVSHEFVAEFEKEHGVHWEDIEARIRAMLREVFLGAAMVHPEMQSDTARAIYGVDVMLDEGMQPKLLEVTYSPDCTRACKYDIQVSSGPHKGEWFRGADFYNTVFGCLFLNETAGVSPL